MLTFELATAATSTGGDFAITVPYLELTVRNTGAGEVAIPARGLPMLLSVELVLERDGGRETRGAGVGDPVPAATQALAAGATFVQRIDPLGDGPREVALAPGTYQATVCVRTGAGDFARAHAGRCSNAVALTVTPTP